MTRPPAPSSRCSIFVHGKLRRSKGFRRSDSVGGVAAAPAVSSDFFAAPLAIAPDGNRPPIESNSRTVDADGRGGIQSPPLGGRVEMNSIRLEMVKRGIVLYKMARL